MDFFFSRQRWVFGIGKKCIYMFQYAGIQTDRTTTLVTVVFQGQMFQEQSWTFREGEAFVRIRRKLLYSANDYLNDL